MNLADVVALACLPVLGSIKIVLNETDEKKLEALNNAYFGSNTSNKSSYASCLRYFGTEKRRKKRDLVRSNMI